MNSNEVSRFGLKRSIDADTRKTIRRNCGFGCVICGEGFAQYDHVDPEFKDAEKHDPEKMTLLCSYHHDEKTHGRMSINEIKEAMKNPAALQKGFVHKTINKFSGKDFKFQFGNLLFNPVPSDKVALFYVDKKKKKFEILAFHYPNKKHPFSVSLRILDDKDQIGFEIVRNMWRYYSDFDIEFSNNRMIIRRKPGKIVLDIGLDVTTSTFTIERMNLKFKDVQIISNINQGLEVKYTSRSTECDTVMEWNGGVVVFDAGEEKTYFVGESLKIGKGLKSSDTGNLSNMHFIGPLGNERKKFIAKYRL